MLQSAPDKAQLIIDRNALIKLEMEVGAEGATEIVMAFLHQGPERIKNMCEAAERYDLDNLFGLSHGFKPICGMLGLSRLCKQIETLANDSRYGQKMDAIARVAAIESEYNQSAGLLCSIYEQKSQKKK